MLQHWSCTPEGSWEGMKKALLAPGSGEPLIELFDRRQPDERPFTGPASSVVADGTPSAEVIRTHRGGRASRRLEDPLSGRRLSHLLHRTPIRGRGVPAAGLAREDMEGTQPERHTSHRCHGGRLGVCLSEGTGTLHHVETFPR